MTLDRLTLAQLLTSEDPTIYRNAMSILKMLRACKHHTDDTGRCVLCFKQYPQLQHQGDDLEPTIT